MLIFSKKNVLLMAISAMTFWCLSAYADHNTEHSISHRTKPIVEVNVVDGSAAPAGESSSAGGQTPESIYQTYCAACHNAGAAGAPKLGDKVAWESRTAKGMETLTQNAINGIGAMPPKGLCMSCSDEDIGATVEYMVAQ